MIKISCVGDSLTHGYLVEDREVNCYPAVLNDLLGEEEYVVGNFGVNGHTMLKSGDAPYWDHEFFKLSALMEPDIVIIMLGSNDSKAHNFTDMDTFIADYEAMIAYYKNLDSKPRLYLNTPPTVFPVKNGATSNIRSTVVNDISQAIINLGRKHRISVIDVNKKTADFEEGFVDDGVHTNKNGANLIANVVFRELSKK